LLTDTNGANNGRVPSLGCVDHHRSQCAAHDFLRGVLRGSLLPA
jgi:hypothetical protein